MVLVPFLPDDFYVKVNLASFGGLISYCELL